MWENTDLPHARARELRHGQGSPQELCLGKHAKWPFFFLLSPLSILQVGLTYFNPQLTLASLEELQPQRKECGKTPHPVDNAVSPSRAGARSPASQPESVPHDHRGKPS